MLNCMGKCRVVQTATKYIYDTKCMLNKYHMEI